MYNLCKYLLCYMQSMSNLWEEDFFRKILGNYCFINLWNL